MYRSLNDEMRRVFGHKLYKLAISGGMTCPNRDGTLDTRGCIFCSAGGAGEFAECGGDVAEQLRRAKARVAAKAKACGYIAYFQPFTNTYAPLPELERLYRAALTADGVEALSVATRPDCLPPETVELLAALSREYQKPVWVELGLQTANPETARYIRRGYPLAVYDDAVRRLKAAHLTVVTHVILGLPNETAEDAYKTCLHVGRVGSDGVKLQLLHVLRGTDLAADFAAGRFSAMTLDAYLPLLAGCVERLPETVVIHRLTGDGAKKDLIAPMWSADKKAVLNAINRYFKENDVRQGAQYMP